MLLTFHYGPVTSPPEGNHFPDMGLPRAFFNFPTVGRGAGNATFLVKVWARFHEFSVRDPAQFSLALKQLCG
jgi:hypothetical protein